MPSVTNENNGNPRLNSLQSLSLTPSERRDAVERFFTTTQGLGRMGRAVADFVDWQIRSGRIGDDGTGSPWWRSVNGYLVLDLMDATAALLRPDAPPSVAPAEATVEVAGAPTSRPPGTPEGDGSAGSGPAGAAGAVTSSTAAGGPAGAPSSPTAAGGPAGAPSSPTAADGPAGATSSPTAADGPAGATSSPTAAGAYAPGPAARWAEWARCDPSDRDRVQALLWEAHQASLHAALARAEPLLADEPPDERWFALTAVAMVEHAAVTGQATDTELLDRMTRRHYPDHYPATPADRAVLEAAIAVRAGTGTGTGTDVDVDVDLAR